VVLSKLEFTVISTEAELAGAHDALCTTALKYVFCVNCPIEMFDSVVDVMAISEGDVNAASLAFCHLTTLPVLPLNTILLDGADPIHTVCGLATVPPTEAAFTVTT
jgi:hypothetical protein